LGFALYRREASGRATVIIDDRTRVEEEHRVAALAYLAWPLAFYERIAPRPDASAWFRIHLRQALWFGNIATIVALVALFWPLVLSLVVSRVTATLWFYYVAIVLDVALFAVWLVLALRYSRSAGRGQLFEIPLVSRVTGTTLPK
jgi:hypothetical protein